MKKKVQIILLLFVIPVVITSIVEIVENQTLDQDCLIYSNSMESLINKYKQMYHSLNIACQLHLKSTAARLKLTFDQLVEKKLDEYITNVERMRSNLYELKFYSIHTEKCQKNNFTADKIKMRNLFNNSFLNSKDELEILKSSIKEIVADKRNLTEFIEKKEIAFNQSVVKYKMEIKSLEKKLREVNVKNKIIYDEKQTLNKTIIVELIKNGEFEVARQLYFKFNEDLGSIILSVYDKNIVNTNKILEFLSSFTNDEDTIYGYRLLYDILIQNHDVYGTATTTIAYRVFVEFNNTYRENKNLVYLHEKLPTSLKTFPWNTTIVVEKSKQYIFVTNNFYLDDSRLIGFMATTNSSDKYVALNLIPVLKGSYFHIKSETTNRHLYADSDEFNIDNQRRGVFWWKKENFVKVAGKWQIEPVKDSTYFKIKNVFWNEYLSVAKDVKLNSYSNPRLFTLKSGKYDDDSCKWNFKNYTGK